MMPRSCWDARIARAGELAATHPSATEILKFYACVAGFQKQVYESVQAAGRDLDTALLAPHFAPLLKLIQRIGPRPLAEAAGELSRGGFEKLLGIVGVGTSADAARTSACATTLDEPSAFFARALLQPYMECLASRRDLPPGSSQPRCPFCGDKPQVGVLRPEGDGGKRSLVCSLCATEWDFRRILCPGCGEESVDKLPVYIAKEFDYVRLEACDSCHAYIKTVDLTRNGLAVPIVDELATVPLNLWAEERGYTKLQPNLLGM